MPLKISIDSINYNELTNTYSITVIKKYSITGTNNIYEYYICPTLPDSSFPENTPIYIKELSVEGSLDINRLGTGELSVSSWRFINNYEENSGLITYGFNAYPEYGHEFRNLTFWFRDIVKDYPPNESNTQNEASYAHGVDLEGTWDGEDTNGAKSWIYIGPFGLQPSEIAKLIVIIFTGVYYRANQKLLNNFFASIIPLIVGAIVTGLTILQPDGGTGLILFFLTIILFFIS